MKKKYSKSKANMSRIKKGIFQTCLSIGCPCHKSDECESAKKVFSQIEKGDWIEQFDKRFYLEDTGEFIQLCTRDGFVAEPEHIIDFIQSVVIPQIKDYPVIKK